MADARIIKRKVEEPEHASEPVKPVMWWDSPQFVHPMEYTEFEKAFCEHVMLTSTDYSLREWRERGYRFVRNVLASDLEKAFTQYRKDHK